MKVYTDAGTKNNGRRGHQQTIIVVSNEKGEVLFERHIGDYTNNEGEILAIIAALRNIEPKEKKEIFSDSKIAVNWTINGKSADANNKKKPKNRLSDRHIHFINTANMLLLLSGSTISWVPREQNLAGHYIERKHGL